MTRTIIVLKQPRNLRFMVLPPEQLRMRAVSRFAPPRHRTLTSPRILNHGEGMDLWREMVKKEVLSDSH